MSLIQSDPVLSVLYNYNLLYNIVMYFVIWSWKQENKVSAYWRVRVMVLWRVLFVITQLFKKSLNKMKKVLKGGWHYLTKMILYKSCFGKTQQKIKFKINFKNLLTNEISCDRLLKLLLWNKKLRKTNLKKWKKFLTNRKQHDKISKLSETATNIDNWTVKHIPRKFF